MDTATLIRDARLAAGLSQRALGSLAGTSGATVSAYESGTKDPRATTLLRLLSAAQVSIETVGWKPASNRFHDLLARRWAELIEEDPSLIDGAAEALDGMSGDYTEAWRHLLAAGVEAVIGVLTSKSEAVSSLKSDAPFGRMRLINEDDRQTLLKQAYAT